MPYPNGCHHGPPFVCCLEIWVNGSSQDTFFQFYNGEWWRWGPYAGQPVGFYFNLFATPGDLVSAFRGNYFQPGQNYSKVTGPSAGSSKLYP